MPPRLDLCARCLRASLRSSSQLRTLGRVRYASVQAVTPAPPVDQIEYVAHPIARHPPSQPPSHRLPEIRRTQLHRHYTSLLRSTAMMLMFHHSNLKATEWMAVRRELMAALAAADQRQVDAGQPDPEMVNRVHIQVVRPSVFGAALKIVEFWDPEATDELHPTDPRTHTSLPVNASTLAPTGQRYTHAASREAYEAVIQKGFETGIEPLLDGPMAVVTFPTLSTEHLKAALSVLSPKAPAFPAPTRRARPGYWDPTAQFAFRKLLLIGARVEGRVLDSDGARWVGTIQGGIDGLRAQLISLLQGAGASVTNTLETATRSLYFTMEGRKEMLEKDAKDEPKTDAKDEPKTDV